MKLDVDFMEWVIVEKNRKYEEMKKTQENRLKNGVSKNDNNLECRILCLINEIEGMYNVLNRCDLTPKEFTPVNRIIGALINLKKKVTDLL